MKDGRVCRDAARGHVLRRREPAEIEFIVQVAKQIGVDPEGAGGQEAVRVDVLKDNLASLLDQIERHGYGVLLALIGVD